MNGNSMSIWEKMATSLYPDVRRREIASVLSRLALAILVVGIIIKMLGATVGGGLIAFFGLVFWAVIWMAAISPFGPRPPS